MADHPFAYCRQDELKRMLRLVGQFVPGRCRKPILRCVLVTAAGGKVTLSATDLESALVVSMRDADVQGDMAFAIPHELLEVRRHVPSPESPRWAVAAFCGAGWSIVGTCDEDCRVPSPAGFPALAVAEAACGAAVPAGRLANAVETARRRSPRGNGGVEIRVRVEDDALVVMDGAGGGQFTARLPGQTFGGPVEMRLYAGLLLPWLSKQPKDDTVFMLSDGECRPHKFWTEPHADAAWVMAGIKPPDAAKTATAAGTPAATAAA